MCKTSPEQFAKERIISLMFNPDLGLCVELGDEKIDNEVYGCGPTQDFIKAVAKEIRFQIRNTGELCEHPTLRSVHKRFQQGLDMSSECMAGRCGLKDEEVLEHYKNYRRECEEVLSKIACYQGWKITITGLNGWIFENLVADLIKREIPSVDITPQPRLYQKGGAKADLLINNRIAVEAKVAGVFDNEDIERLGKNRTAAEKKGWTYLYISRMEKHRPYYEKTLNKVGQQNAFFLDSHEGDWNRFIKRISQLLNIPKL